MRINILAAAAVAILTVAGCSKHENSDGNGPGTADGTGGQTDSAAPATPGAAPGTTATDSVPPPVESTGNTDAPPPKP